MSRKRQVLGDDPRQPMSERARSAKAFAKFAAKKGILVGWRKQDVAKRRETP